MQNPFINYCVGKKVGEKAIWAFVEKEKPPFHVTNFCPPLLMGPPLHKIKNMKNINFSTNFIHSVFDGTWDTVGKTMFPAYVRISSTSNVVSEGTAS